MIMQAMNKFILNSREYYEQIKSQYTDKGEVKDYFRASELGSADRKIIYSFFKHQISTIPRSAKSLTQLANGDGVHTRYQTWWEDMGALISMEEKVSSKDDDYLKDYEWEWAGHYDGLLDVNVLRAHANGLCTVSCTQTAVTEVSENAEVGETTAHSGIEVDIDDAYATSIGIFEEGYVPTTMVADIKTMNPWSFKKVAQGDISGLRGYIDQITFYMYMLNTPYGSIYIEDKASNDIVEIQVLWHDMHEGVDYQFTTEVHGEATENVLRVTVDSERFFGSDTVLGVVPRINQLWETKKLLEQSQETDEIDIADVMPPRCSEDPSSFPCSWGGGKEKCEFFNHCWNPQTNGLAVSDYEACPEEAIWRLAKSDGTLVEVDSRKVPEGVTLEALTTLLIMDAIVIDQFLVDKVTENVSIAELEEAALIDKNILNTNGELNLEGTGIVSDPIETKPADTEKEPANTPDIASPSLPNVAIEYLNSEGKKSIKCLNCGKELTYQKLGNGCTKKCESCQNLNKVLRA